MSPELHIRALAQEDVPESGVSRVAGPGQHHIASVYLPGEQHAIAVVRQKGVFHLVERLEIICISDADGGAMVAVAPCDIVAVLDPDDPGIVAVLPLRHIRVSLEGDGLMIDLPVDGILAETREDVHAHAQAVAAEDPCVAVAERHYGAVEDAVGDRYLMPADDGILRIAPGGLVMPFRLVLPGHPGQCFSNDFAHI